ncbi:TIGR03619 family F420-dependent LLM class oxidoreductase [Parahaliea sp. F7430]|uniref:TIGR03619 family F420-dependent LLM class oxidoreductase n=1 Tax=Sediminihaliea albiluteola TaxID=2758564 RepID=A0A7W2TUT8_9GAMM|nr:TIGR03619 family F420-dependent LLM class oxidoreductase [Sediminihaliea albiluteola]MBA6412365.1 TIGR03619 family F420-dependent LLM class oxidoreductase [Sediminihaliea albiluteola]
MSKALRVGITLFRIDELTHGDMGKVLAMAEMADAKGVDMLSIPDHICFSSDAAKDYPMGPDAFPGTLDEPWYEPLTLLAAIGARTKQILLSTAVMIAPARTAVMLAKQLATLDCISNGRAVPVFGAGWQRAEFDSQNLPFEGRFTHMEEQIQVCRALWSGGPQSFQGKFVQFEDLWSYPLPVQGAALPIWLGLSPSPRNIERMARFADGWLPAMESLEKIKETRDKLSTSLEKHGRDPENFDIRSSLIPVPHKSGGIDFDATFAQAENMKAAGVTVIDTAPTLLTDRLDDLEMILDRLVALRE